MDGIHIYRHWISSEAGGFVGFIAEYVSALWGELGLCWKVWWKHRFKLIHLCNPPDILFLQTLPFKLMGVRVIYDVHDAWPEMFEAKFGNRGLLYWMVRAAERLTYLCADTVLATNESVRAIALERGGMDPSDVFIVRTAPNIQVHEAQPDPALKKDRRFLVGYVGVMGDADGVTYAVEAMDHLVKKMGRTDVQFLLMGTGPEYKKLIARRDELGLQDYVDLPGRVSNEFLFSALKTIDLGISCDPINPYNDHCTMNKVLEYMAFGKPQVLFDLKEGRFSAGDAARYVGENSAVALAQEIAKALDDPRARDAMSQQATLRFRKELNWERSVQQLLLAYGRTLSH